MKKKKVFICLSLAFILTLSFTTKTSNIAKEEEVPRPTSIYYTSFL
ncbi:hypothetical protein [Psychrobacillus sp. OK032]|nr:hypothetical protein [Psychrobacillus sp. OK032]SES10516.1 hypothetical protein SAMN05518872_104221 [Psychrobacillus sp. OK032]